MGQPFVASAAAINAATCVRVTPATDYSLVATLFAGYDSNSRYRHVQTRGQETPQRVVCPVFHGRRCEANFERGLIFAFDRIATGARRDTNCKNN